MTTPINVLVSLHRGYGLGDAVQVSAVLRHVVAARPNWRIDYQAEDGKHQVGRGIVQNTFAYGDTYPSLHYDAEVQICLYDKWYGFTDRPNTHVSACLRDCFDVDWKPEFGRYAVNMSPETRKWIKSSASSRAVALHFKGKTDKERKDLTDSQAEEICNAVYDLDRNPYLMGDWIDRGHEAEVNCTIIDHCEAFVGIDSGPSKCASATNTPSLVVWTGHHPAQFHDPAPNTTHLVPAGYHAMYPVRNDPLVVKWFEEHYNVIEYTGDPVYKVKQWLTETLS